MTLTQDVLVEVVDEVMGTFVGAVIEPMPSDPAGDLPVTAFVHVTGEWAGSVLVSCSERLATAAAAAMLNQPEGSLQPGDVSDALGEVANMIGGSIKALMPEPSTLSLPVVTFGAAETVVPGSELLQRLERSCIGEPLRVTVLHGAGTAAD